MGLVYAFIDSILRWFRRKGRDPASPREAIRALMEEMQSPRAEWKARTGGKHAAPDVNHEIGCFMFFAANRNSVAATFDALGTSSTLEIRWQGAELLIEYVKGEVSSFYFNGEKFDDVHPEVRLNKNLLTQLLRNVHKAVGFYVGRESKGVEPREYARPHESKPLDYGRPDDKRKKKRRKRLEDAD